MGRKGVSKRKPKKSKSPPVSKENSTKGAVSTLVNASESSEPKSLSKGEGIFMGKGGKKKFSDTQKYNKKR